MGHVFSVVVKGLSANPSSQVFLPCFLLEALWFLLYIRLYGPLWINFCGRNKVCIQVYFVHVDDQLLMSSTIFWEDWPISFELPFLLCQISVGFTCVSLFLGFLFCFINLFICCFSNTTLPWLLQLLVSLEIKNCESSNYVVCLQCFMSFFTSHPPACTEQIKC